MPLRVYNTLTRRKEIFEPLSPGHVKMFVCGPTVYDEIHLGHARTYIIYDIVARYFISKGYSLLYLVNITDVDEKVFSKAEQLKVSFETVADKYTEDFLRDLASLNINTVSMFPKASCYIEQIIAQVEKLVEKGYAYVVDGNVYFDTSKFTDYGRLSSQTMLELKLKRIDPDPLKKNQADFILWRRWDKGEPSWLSPFGRGRPGWHIEDTAITITNFGSRYDIHGGAVDLIFPHHEAEIAQGEALTGEKPLVKYWIHIATLNIKGEKMSKSLGNYITVKDILSRYDADALRLYFAFNQRRRQISFREEGLKEAAKEMHFIRRVMSTVRSMRESSKGDLRVGESGYLKDVEKYGKAFCVAMDDDFNTSKAVRILIALTNMLNKRLTEDVSKELVEKVYLVLSRMFSIVGLSEGKGMPVSIPIPCRKREY